MQAAVSAMSRNAQGAFRAASRVAAAEGKAGTVITK